MNVPADIISRPERRRFRFRVETFELLMDNGVFADAPRAELIDGDITYMSAQLARHGRAKMRLALALIEHLKASGSDLEVLTEVSVRVADDGMPEPDIMLTSYRGPRTVPAETVALVVEVSDTTLAIDLGRKADLYAAVAIPEYWVIDLNTSRAVVHIDPRVDGYRSRRELPLGEPLISSTIVGLEVATDGLLG